MHIFLKCISPKLCNISTQLRVCFRNLATHFRNQAQFEYAGPLNLDKIAYTRRSTSATLQLRATLHIFLKRISQHFDRTQSIFSKFSETFPLPGPHRICWPPQLGQNRLSPRRSTLTTLQLRASLHIFVQRIWHKLCKISKKTQSIFSKFSETFPLPHPDRICWPLNLDKIAYLRVAQPQRRYSSGLVCTYFYNVSDTNYA